MINSKLIRILCHFFVGVSYVLAVASVFFGIFMLTKDSYILGGALIGAGLIDPLLTHLALYPVYALSLIETHTASMNDKFDQLTTVLTTQQTPQVPSPSTPQADDFNYFKMPTQDSAPQKKSNKTDILATVVGMLLSAAITIPLLVIGISLNIDNASLDDIKASYVTRDDECVVVTIQPLENIEDLDLVIVFESDDQGLCRIEETVIVALDGVPITFTYDLDMLEEEYGIDQVECLYVDVTGGRIKR